MVFETETTLNIEMLHRKCKKEDMGRGDTLDVGSLEGRTFMCYQLMINGVAQTARLHAANGFSSR